MTDYSGRNRSKNKLGASWRSVLSVFLVLIISVALLNGLIRRDNSRDSVKPFAWDGIAPFSVVVAGKDDFIAVFQKEPKRIAIFDIGNLDGLDGSQLMKKVSVESGVFVKNFILADNGDLETLKRYSSIKTPVRIILGTFSDMETNVSRFDALRLWWQAKSIRPDDITTVDLSTQKADSKVLGLDTKAANRKMKPYFENFNVISEDIEISVNNASGEESGGIVAGNFISSIGGRIVDVSKDAAVRDGCLIEGGKSYTRDYLATLFDCDINDGIYSGEDEANLTITIGQSFVENYN